MANLLDDGTRGVYRGCTQYNTPLLCASTGKRVFFFADVNSKGDKNARRASLSEATPDTRPAETRLPCAALSDESSV